MSLDLSLGEPDGIGGADVLAEHLEPRGDDAAVVEAGFGVHRHRAVASYVMPADMAPSLMTHTTLWAPSVRSRATAMPSPAEIEVEEWAAPNGSNSLSARLVNADCLRLVSGRRRRSSGLWMAGRRVVGKVIQTSSHRRPAGTVYEPRKFMLGLKQSAPYPNLPGRFGFANKHLRSHAVPAVVNAPNRLIFARHALTDFMILAENAA